MVCAILKGSIYSSGPICVQSSCSDEIAVSHTRARVHVGTRINALETNMHSRQHHGEIPVKYTVNKKKDLGRSNKESNDWCSF